MRLEEILRFETRGEVGLDHLLVQPTWDDDARAPDAIDLFAVKLKPIAHVVCPYSAWIKQGGVTQLADKPKV